MRFLQSPKVKTGSYNTRKLSNVLKIMFLILSFYTVLFTQITLGSSCSVITTSTDNAVWFGYNEDRFLELFDQETFVRFHPKTQTTYAFMEITVEVPNFFSVRVGMNTEGVAISGNGLSQQQLNPQSGKLYSWEYHSIYRLILQNCANISDAITMIQNYDFGPSMGFQLHIADAKGKAIVISPGSDGEVVITQKQISFMISTNVNRADIESGSSDLRNDIAVSLLEDENSLDKDVMKSVLDTIHYESFEGCTYYSSIFDLTNRNAYFYLMHNYGQEVSFNITQELLLGDHSYLLSELFPNGADILDAAKERLQLQEAIFILSRFSALILSILVIGHFIIKVQRTRKEPHTKSSKKSIFLKSSGIHIFGIVFLVINQALLPAVFLTNFLDQIRFRIISFEYILFIIFLSLWVVSFLLLGYKIKEKYTKV